MSHLFSICQLQVSYNQVPVVKDISLDLEEGQILGIVGESGSGKSTLIHASLGILGQGGSITEGSICYQGQNLLQLPKEAFRRLRGKELSLIAQDPVESFHPLRRIKQELTELVRAHSGMTQEEAQEEMLRFLEAFRLPEGKELLERYAFELSGGICQRVSIAMAMALHPRILFADEPTSALDVTVQKLVVEELLRLRETEGTAFVIVSHNMGVISHLSDTIFVMYAGIAVETGSRQTVIRQPLHPYTQALLQAIPRMNGPLPAGIFSRRTGTPPLPGNAGCPYAARCPRRTEQCTQELPSFSEAESGHQVRCWHI